MIFPLLFLLICCFFISFLQVCYLQPVFCFCYVGIGIDFYVVAGLCLFITSYYYFQLCYDVIISFTHHGFLEMFLFYLLKYNISTLISCFILNFSCCFHCFIQDYVCQCLIFDQLISKKFCSDNVQQFVDEAFIEHF